MSRVSPVSSTAHLASASSVHVPPVARAASAHVAPSGPHVTPHGAAPGRATQDGHVAPVEVPTAREASSDVQGGQEVAGGAGEATVGPWACRKSRTSVRLPSVSTEAAEADGEPPPL